MASVQKVQIVADLTKELPPKRKRGLRRTNKEWEETISLHIGKFIDKLTAEDLTKLAIFACTATLIKKTNILPMPVGAWFPSMTWTKEELDQVEWLYSVLYGYLVVYKPEACINAARMVSSAILPWIL